MNVSGGNSSRFTATQLSEINATPFVDVMLVLLIVFMISAPLMQQGAQVNLPKAEAGALDDVPDQIVLVIQGEKNVLFNGEKLKPGELKKRLIAFAQLKPKVQVVVRADRKVPYGLIAHVIALVKKANIHSVGLATEPGKSGYKI